MKKEQIIYGCYPSLFSTLIANILVVEKQIPLTCIMVSTKPVTIEKVPVEGIKGLRFLKKRLSNKFFMFQLMMGTIIPIIYTIQCLIKGKKIYSLKTLCTKYQIQYLESKDFNQDIHTFEDVDVFLSMCLDQRIDKNFIDRVKTLCINIHPSDLPNFGGVEPIIMFLLSPEKQMGISIHKMTPKIDQGSVICRKYIERGNHSYFSLMRQFIKYGTDMFYELYEAQWQYCELEQLEQRYPYRSWPTKEELLKFEQRYSYITIKDLTKY